jgi:16S rRNA (guanine966-N2)-methyltransferase
MTQRHAARPGSVRIIAGSHRGRRIPIADQDALRPTPDRVRETVFNWLAPFIDGARVLDVCAGTGVLALESLSRGAASALAIESDVALARGIEQAASAFGLVDRLRVVAGDAASALARLDGRFDVVFIDPPYPADAWLALATRLEQARLLAPEVRVYVEWPAERETAPVPAHWETCKASRAGRVRYGLFRPGPATPSPAGGSTAAASGPE